LPGTQRAAAIARLQGHLVKKTRDSGRGGRWRCYLVQRLAEPITILPAVTVAAELAVPKQPKCSDIFAAIRTGHDRAHPAHFYYNGKIAENT
jgi:hypothetical protein